MSGISTHVLDTSKGEPARGVRVILERQSSATDWVLVGEGLTDANGRISQLLPEPEAAGYRLSFHVAEYFEPHETFYAEVVVHFVVRDPFAHYHIPLLLSPYGYTTYRGS